jgi:hypothetical protein
VLHDSFVFAVVANCLMRLRYLSDFAAVIVTDFHFFRCLVL